ncbi:MAG TPA: transposase [Thermoleophilia bacterium]|nr:transposase [Thermoleophilia bacterium]
MTFDDETRARLAREWMNSSLTQEQFCAQHNIATRTLRQWVEKHGTGRRPAAHALAIVDNAIAQLVALRDALVAEEACQVGADDDLDHEVAEQPDERHAGAKEHATAAPQSSPVEVETFRPMPMPAPGTFCW